MSKILDFLCRHGIHFDNECHEHETDTSYTPSRVLCEVKWRDCSNCGRRKIIYERFFEYNMDGTKRVIKG